MKPELALSVVSLFAAAPALAQNNGAWSVKSERATVVASGISIPLRASTLSLIKTAEASQKGKGLDNVAQYASEDAATQGTIYIFFSTYADTALATWATDRAVRQRYGPDLAIADDRIVAVAGVPAATRRLYDKGYFEAGKPLATAAGFVRAGSWLIGLRVTGPATRRAEVESAIDALIAGLRFDGKAKPMTAAPLKVSGCPIGAEKPAKYLDDKKAGATALFASLLGGSIVLDAKEKETIGRVVAPPAFPANGASPLCVRGTIVNGSVRNDVLQPLSADDGQILLVPTDDAGGVVTVEPIPFGDGFVVKQYGIGFIDVMGSFRTMPSLDQIGAILGGRDKKGGTVRSSTIITPDGDSTTQVNTDTLK